MAIDNGVIEKIIDYEKLAQSVMDEARRQRKAHDANMQREAEEYRRSADEQASFRIRDYEQRQTAVSRDADKKAQADADARIAALKAKASLEGARWADELYAKIIDGGIG